VFGGALLAVLSVGVALAAGRARVRPLIAVAVVLAVSIQIPVRTVTTGWPPPGWLVVACDVGQGDALVLSAGGGTALVIDAGPDPIAADRCLRALGVSEVGLLVLTHSHLDHVGGIAGVLHDRRIDAALTSPLAEPAAGHRLAADALAARGVSLDVARAGQRFVLGRGRDALDIEVLGPRQVLRSTRSDPNNSSVVLRVRSRGETVLLPGDAEVEAQDDLLAAGVDVSADILKVPHHGSAYSDPAFLQRVHARIGLISVGAGNDYGHPSPLLTAELARLGVAAYRTDLAGDVAVVVDGGRVGVRTRSTRSGNT
jgi:competence protein ComEC